MEFLPGVVLLFISGSGALPDPALTPGAIADNRVEMICALDYDKLHRPNSKISHYLKLQAMERYHYPKSDILKYESDALVPVAIGGDHYNILNIWPQKCDQWNGYRCVAGDAYKKDIKENAARKNVCSLFIQGQPDAAQSLLLQYQQNFMNDWNAF